MSMGSPVFDDIIRRSGAARLMRLPWSSVHAVLCRADGTAPQLKVDLCVVSLRHLNKGLRFH
jgi:hypothetical protein